MKRGLLFAFLVILSIAIVNAEPCVLDATLVNQDPYPAVPGEYVKVVFQVTGLSNPECGEVEFELLQQFPFSLDPGVSAIRTFSGGTYARNYQSFATVPYEIRVDSEALDGSTPLEVSFSSPTGLRVIEKFDLEIEDVKTDFEISIEDFLPAENKITFSILNIGKSDVEAVVVEIPKQDSIEVKGSSREIVGSLDSNDDTTFSYEAIPKEGEIKLVVYYTDTINVRRSLEKTVYYDSSYFTGRVRDQEKPKTTLYIVVAIIVLIVIWRIFVSVRKKREAKRRAESHRR